MKKDLVIKLIKMIENNRLDEDLVSDLLKRNERLLEMLISLDSNFKNGVLVLKNNLDDGCACEALMELMNTKDKKRDYILDFLASKGLTCEVLISDYIKYFMDIPDDKVFMYENIFDILSDINLINERTNYTYANFLINNAVDLNSSYYLTKYFKSTDVSNKGKNIQDRLREACIIARNRNFFGYPNLIKFFEEFNIDDEEITVEAASVISNCKNNGYQVRKYLTEKLSLISLRKDYRYYLEIAKILGDMENPVVFNLMIDVINKNLDVSDILLMMRVLNNVKIDTITNVMDGNTYFFEVTYGSIQFSSSYNGILGNIKRRIINTNYVYYQLLEQDVVNDINDDIMVGALPSKLERIRKNVNDV